MLAGEAWWEGRDEFVSDWLDKRCPPSLNQSYIVKAAARKAGFRDCSGLGWDEKVLDKYLYLAVQYSTWKQFMTIELASEEAADRAKSAIERLETHLAAFRSKIGNDLTSIKAASQRVQTEVQSMSDKYVVAQSILTSPEFEKALLNAERMATALKAISELSDTKLSVAVFGGGRTT